MLLLDGFIEDLRALPVQSPIRLLLTQKWKREDDTEEGHLRQSREHLRQHLHLVRVERVEALLVHPHLYRYVGRVVQRVHYRGRNGTRHYSIQTEAAQDDACDEIPPVREVAPRAEQWDKIDHTEAYASDHGVYEEEEGEAFGELGAVDCRAPDEAAKHDLHPWVHLVHQHVASLHSDRANCERGWEHNDSELEAELRVMPSHLACHINYYVSPDRCDTKSRLYQHSREDSAKTSPSVFLPGQTTAWKAKLSPLSRLFDRISSLEIIIVV